MLETPPAIVQLLPDVPRGFSIVEKDPGQLQFTAMPRCRTTDSEAIVVCGRRNQDSRFRLPPASSANPPLIEDASDALSGKIGPFEVGSLRQEDGTRRLGIRMRF